MSATSQSPGAPPPEPYGALRFKVEIPGVEIGYFTECSGLTVEWEVTDYQEGGLNTHAHRLRGRAKYPNLVLKRGVTSEEGLMAWFFKTQTQVQRPTVIVSITNPAGQAVRHWSFAGAFPVKWTGPTLNAGTSSMASESLEIAHDGFVLDG